MLADTGILECWEGSSSIFTSVIFVKYSKCITDTSEHAYFVWKPIDFIF